MFLLPERAQPAPQVHELPVESRQLSGALRFGSQSGHVGRSADLLGSIDSEALVSIDTEVLPSRIQLAPHARRRAVPMTVSERRMPVLCELSSCAGLATRLIIPISVQKSMLTSIRKRALAVMTSAA